MPPPREGGAEGSVTTVVAVGTCCCCCCCRTFAGGGGGRATAAEAVAAVEREGGTGEVLAVPLAAMKPPSSMASPMLLAAGIRSYGFCSPLISPRNREREALLIPSHT